MYRALTSFTTNNYQVQLNEILEDDFTTANEIEEFLRIGYIEVYDSSLEITENGIYNVEDYETADVDVPTGIDTSDADATAEDILKGKTAYVKGEKITGTLEVEPPLPYSELEYIAGTGTQWIDTGISPSSDIMMRVQFNMPGNCEIIVGTNVPGNENKAYRLFSNSNKWYYDFGSGLNGNRLFTSGFPVNQTVAVELGNRYVKNLATGGNVMSSTAVSAFNYNDLSIGIFASPDNHTGPTTGKIYYLAIYNGNILVRNLIPVRRTSDNEICMYDKVTKQFFTNAGTGNFTPGPELM